MGSTRLIDNVALELVDGEYSRALGHAVRFHYSDGHTPGLMLAEIVGEHGNGGVVFCADLIPGRAWVHLPVTMGYDRYPERLIDEKLDFLADKLARDGVAAVFASASDACAAAVHAQARLVAVLPVRMGVHSGPVTAPQRCSKTPSARVPRAPGPPPRTRGSSASARAALRLPDRRSAQCSAGRSSE